MPRPTLEDATYNIPSPTIIASPSPPTYPRTTLGNVDKSPTSHVPHNSQTTTPLSCPNKLYFVPSCLLSNVMSLAPKNAKIDEIALTITQQDIDIVFITETWLRQSIPNDPINIKGYQLFRRDRTNRLHGGILFVRKKQY